MNESPTTREQAFSEHGELVAPADGAGVVLLREDGEPSGRLTGCARVRYTRRGAAARVARMCASNMLMLAGSMLPLRVEFAPGAVDDGEEAGEGGDDAPVPAPDLAAGKWWRRVGRG